jgi:hypothetical protein
MRVSVLGLAAVAILVACAPYQPRPFQSVVLAEHYARELRHLCSRPGIPEFQGTWTPSVDEVEVMESRFRKLQRVRAKLCCIVGAYVGDVNDFYRQYIGVVAMGKRYIYVNAYPVEADSVLSDTPVNQICDGGDAYWGVLYDVESGIFVDLAFNGLA